MKNRINQVCGLLLVIFILSLSSCVAIVTTDAPHDNGQHKGWYKNRNNPHNPNTTNPGHTKKKK
ncbi:MAG: hypothetical protein H7282_04475 [Cytophagaceae bacterium]|nr:hypothetical protein [Cytophagaceae bacterium]